MMWITALLCAALLGISSACDFGPSSPLETRIVCRVTKPAALVLNEQTAQVIQAAFRHATYPNISGEKSVRFLGKVTYGLTNIQISNLSIESSHVELREDDAVNIMIRNVSSSFKGTLSYGYGAWFMDFGQFIDIELYSSTDLEVNTKLTCRKNRVAADTSDCYLSFHKLVLHLHGDKQPGWIKQLFTDFISFTLKLVLKSQICKEINHMANLLADFIQNRAEDFLSDGDIRMNTDITAFPIIKSNYMESHHKGLLLYKDLDVPYNSAKFSPSLLTDHKMLYIWFSEEMLNALALAAFMDNRLELLLTGDTVPVFQQMKISDCHTKVWSLIPPEIKVTPKGVLVKSSVATQLQSSSNRKPPTSMLYFETDSTVEIQASYADKKLMLNVSDSVIHIKNTSSSLQTFSEQETLSRFLRKAVSEFAVPELTKRVECALTSLLNSKGLALFDIIDPEIILHEGYLIVQLDFGFPHHLLVDFLKKSL